MFNSNYELEGKAIFKKIDGYSFIGKWKNNKIIPKF